STISETGEMVQSGTRETGAAEVMIVLESGKTGAGAAHQQWAKALFYPVTPVKGGKTPIQSEDCWGPRTTAVTSISTLARSSTRPATCTAVMAGKCRPMTLR